MGIEAITVPKWGLEMEEGTLVEWHIEEGQDISAGEDLVEIETEKVTNVVESPVSGTLVKRLGAEDETYPCGALLGVIADRDTEDAEIDAFILQYEELQSTRAADDADRPAAEFIEVDGRRIRFLRIGEEGEPVILIHGFGGDLQNWMFIQPDLATDHVTYAIDLPGHGGSDKNLDGIDGLKGMGCLIVLLMAALDIEAAHLVGHSMGGEVALQALMAESDRVLSLTLLAPTGAGVAANPEFVDGFITGRRNRDMKPVIEKLFTDPALVSADLVDNLIKYKRLDGVKAALDTLSSCLKQPSSALQEAAVALPKNTAIAWGTADRVVPHDPQAALPDGIESELLEGMGHMPHLEAPQEILRIIRRQLG